MLNFLSYLFMSFENSDLWTLHLSECVLGWAPAPYDPEQKYVEGGRIFVMPSVKSLPVWSAEIQKVYFYEQQNDNAFEVPHAVNQSIMMFSFNPAHLTLDEFGRWVPLPLTQCQDRFLVLDVMGHVDCPSGWLWAFLLSVLLSAWSCYIFPFFYPKSFAVFQYIKISISKYCYDYHNF